MFDSYIICATPRSGSTLLCGLLETSGAGRPDSFYGRAFRDDWAREWKLPERAGMEAAAYERAYLEAAIACGKGRTPLFGLRLMQENVVDLSEALTLVFPGLPNASARFARAFGRILYIHLNRADKLAQAVSYIKARQTGLWHVAPDGREIERLGSPAEPRYDHSLISSELVKFEAQDAAWGAWFTAQGIAPHRIGYEALSRDPGSTLTGICRALGVEPPSRGEVAPAVARLYDATNAEWIRRYEAGDVG